MQNRRLYKLTNEVESDLNDEQLNTVNQNQTMSVSFRRESDGNIQLK